MSAMRHALSDVVPNIFPAFPDVFLLLLFRDILETMRQNVDMAIVGLGPVHPKEIDFFYRARHLERFWARNLVNTWEWILKRWLRKDLSAI